MWAVGRCGSLGCFWKLGKEGRGLDWSWVGQGTGRGTALHVVMKLLGNGHSSDVVEG